jgi:hypothetical protein
MQPIDLIKHPEGGRFCEVFRSKRIVTNQDGDKRSALTHIYFELKPGEVSRFHRVASDEIWNLYQGPGLYLYTWDGSNTVPTRTILASEKNNFCHVVLAGTWQAAEPILDSVLVGCSVAPGFEFADFTLIEPNSGTADLLISVSPEMKRFIISQQDKRY